MDSEDFSPPPARTRKRLPLTRPAMPCIYPKPFFINENVTIASLLDPTMWRKEVLAFTMLVGLREEVDAAWTRSWSVRYETVDSEDLLRRWEVDNEDQIEDDLQAREAQCQWIISTLLPRLASWAHRVDAGWTERPNDWRSFVMWEPSPNQQGESVLRVVHPDPHANVEPVSIRCSIDENVPDSQLARLYWIRRKWDWDFHVTKLQRSVSEWSDGESDIVRAMKLEL